MRSKLFTSLFLGLILSITFFVLTASAKEYKVSELDVLQITTYDHDDLTSTVRVNRDGTITFPLLGKVKVVGLTVSQVEEKLVRLLADGYIVNPQVRVFIEDFRSRIFYVTGEVKKPDAYKYEDDSTIIKAITIAGGFTEIAAKGKVKILRKEEGKEKVLENVDMDQEVLPDDVIVVPESFF